MIYTKNYLENKFNQKRTYENFEDDATFIEKAINQQKIYQKSLSEYDIFLSHSYLDKKIVKALHDELEEFGYKVFVDWIIGGDKPRNNVTKETVGFIKNAMNKSKSLILATSKNSINSDWTTWEVGYIDAKKNRCAILPIIDDDSAEFRGMEFMNEYPVVYKSMIKNENGEHLLVKDKSTNKYSKYRRWMDRGVLETESTIDLGI